MAICVLHLLIKLEDCVKQDYMMYFVLFYVFKERYIAFEALNLTWDKLILYQESKIIMIVEAWLRRMIHTDGGMSGFGVCVCVSDIWLASMRETAFCSSFYSIKKKEPKCFLLVTEVRGLGLDLEAALIY